MLVLPNSLLISLYFSSLRNGIRWNFTSTLEDLDFADDIVLLSSKYQQIQDKTNRQVDNAGRVV